MLNTDLLDLASLVKNYIPYNEEILSINYNDRSLGRVVILTPSYELVYYIKTRDFITKERES
jgi:hypothetical protein